MYGFKVCFDQKFVIILAENALFLNKKMLQNTQETQVFKNGTQTRTHAKTRVSDVAFACACAPLFRRVILLDPMGRNMPLCVEIEI